MKLVIDASVALKWILDEPDKEAALSLINEDLCAPSFWMIEAADVLWRRARRLEITAQEARYGLSTLHDAPVRTVPDAGLLNPAFDLAARLTHPVYDCLYIALAVSEHRTLVTADKRLHLVASRDPILAPHVQLLSA